MITKKQEVEFDRIVECVMSQGDIDCITDLIPDDVKKTFIDDWKEGGD